MARRRGRTAQARAGDAMGTVLGRLIRAVLTLFVLALLTVATLLLLYRVMPVPTTVTMETQRRAQGGLVREWVALDDVAPSLALSVLAAEDARFCEHWGIDLAAVRAALAEGGSRGASTISQQTVKNVFLWQGRSWVRKALEAMMTPALEAAWPKRRILEVYLNVAEWGPGVFGAEAAAQHWYDVPAAQLTAEQAARLAVILPAPRDRDPTALGPTLRRHAASVAAGARTLAETGRADCLEPLGGPL